MAVISATQHDVCHSLLYCFTRHYIVIIAE